MLRMDNVLTTNYDTRLVGVLAHPVRESAIFDMLSRAASVSDCGTAFLQFDAQPKDLADPVRALQVLKARGIYLSGLLRASAGALVDYLSDEAHGTGIINVMTFDGDQTRGHNTEARALISVLEPHRNVLQTGGAVVLGGGAMARAAAYALIRGYRTRFVAIADRTLQQAQVLRQLFVGLKTDTKIEAHELFPPDIAQLLVEARVIINATAIGSIGNEDETAITIPDVFHSRQIVVDTVFNPSPTRMLRDAFAAGAQIITGEEILAKQVEFAFELLTETKWPAEKLGSWTSAESPA